eukprot:1659532-Pleurochrysis_carterae.AAC.1
MLLLSGDAYCTTSFLTVIDLRVYRQGRVARATFSRTGHDVVVSASAAVFDTRPPSPGAQNDETPEDAKRRHAPRRASGYPD